MTEIGRQGAEARGSGVGSRQDFVLPAKWYTEKHEYASHETITFISPGKTRYHSSGKVKEILNERGMDLCLNASSESSNDESHSDSEDSQAKRFKEERILPVVEHQLLVCESTQVSAFVNSINKTSRCFTVNCHGKCICLLFWGEVPLNLDPCRRAMYE